ncbi:DUF2064 domain-containing protein [Nocardiaceae bacterium NPDC056970]
MSDSGLDLDVAVLVVAKAPVPGLAKTRLAADIGDDRAADIAAAAMLDTLAAVAGVRAAYRIVALTGNLELAARRRCVMDALHGVTVIEQRGAGFAERLVYAHVDSAEIAGLPVLQIGMDTPQVTSSQLSSAARILTQTERPTVLGPAADGGWWALGVPNAAIAAALSRVSMSRPDTGIATHSALTTAGARVRLLPLLRDVDSADDLVPVAGVCQPRSLFRDAVASLYHHRR